MDSTTNFQGASLSIANLQHADLREANLDYGNDSCTIHTQPIPPTSWA